jgi:hypothetical protein
MRFGKRPERVVWVDGRAIRTAEVIASERLPKETGGILIGYRESNTVKVNMFVEVPDEKAGRYSYIRRHATAEAALGEVLRSKPALSPMGYVGEWHTHPGSVGASRQDLQEVSLVAKHALGVIAFIVLTFDMTLNTWVPQAWAADRKVHHSSQLLIEDADNRR